MRPLILSRPAQRFSWEWCLAGLVVLFLASRLLILFSNYTSVSNLEELLRGTVAKELAKGLQKPVSFYMADSYSGGGAFLTALLASSLYRFFGPSLFWLKITPVLFYSLPSLVLLFALIKRNFSDWAAAWAGLLFVFSPAALLTITLKSWGCYNPSLTVTLLMLFLLYEVLLHGNSARIIYAALGFLSSMGIWLAYPILSIAAAVGLNLILFKRSDFFGVRGLIFLAAFSFGVFLAKGIGFLPGFGPLGFFIHYAFAVKETPLSLTALSGFLERFWTLIALMAHSFWPFAFIPILFLTRDPVVKRTYPLLVYVGLYFFFAGFSAMPLADFQDPPLTFRHLALLQLVLLILLAVLFSLRRNLWPAGIVLLSLYGVWIHFTLMKPFFWGQILRHKAYAYYPLGELWQPLSRQNHESSLREILPGLSPSDRAPFYRAFVLGYPFSAQDLKELPLEKIQSLEGFERRFFLKALGRFYAFENFSNLREIIARVRPLSAPDAESFYRGLGFGAVSRGDSLILEYLKQLDFLESQYRPLFYLNLGILLYNKGESAWEEAFKIFQPMPEAQKVFVYRGIGRDAGATAILSRLSFAKMIESVPVPLDERTRADFFWGVGWGVRNELKEDRARAVDWVKIHIPARYQNQALRGIEDYDRYYDESQSG